MVMKTKKNLSKSKMKELKLNREKYFPVIELLLYVESRTDSSELPIEMTDVSQMAVVMELIDIGYLDSDCFIIQKNRGIVSGLSYKGGHPLTRQGMDIYREHLHLRRGRFVRGVMLLLLVILGLVVLYISTKGFK